MRNVTWRIRLVVLIGLLALAGVTGSARAALPAGAGPVPLSVGQSAAPAGPLPNGATVIYSEKNDVSPAFRDLPLAAPVPRRSEVENRGLNKRQAREQPNVDTVVQTWLGPAAMPAPSANFEGINVTSGCGACYPPDPNGAVGPNHFVETVNTAYAVYNKSGGLLLAPRPISTLWTGFGGPCSTRNDGDPLVKYDRLADRWLINQFTSAAPYYQCIAVSTGPDPTGTYNRYAFLESSTVFGDYQKIGVWPDAYYMSNNEFNASDTFVGAGNYAFNRAAMLAGVPASAIYFHLPATDWGGQQPSDFEGSIPPPPGAPNTFLEIDDQAWDPAHIPQDEIQMWRFHADFANPAAASFTALSPLHPAPFDGILCNFNPCVPQPGTAVKLDAISDRLMYRAVYRNFGDHQAIVFNHTVDTGTNKAAVRWYELRGIHTVPSIYQQGTFDPNTDQHWMGSVALDANGNMALGYSVSSAATFPSVRYTGRLAGDPLGTLPQGEGVIINGTGSQTGAGGRWGDYTSLVVDPSDDCTFWYTNEYLTTTGTAPWHTRIGAFKFPTCAAAPPVTPTPAASPTPCSAGQFSDVHPADYFYTPVQYLAAHGIVSGYGDCTFRPYNNTTRAQMVKIVVNGFAVPAYSPPNGYTFADVPADHPFWTFVEAAGHANIVSGYACGGVGEPCDTQNRPYFRPSANVTRSQLSKIVVVAAGYALVNPPTPTFTDVAPASAFYTFVETASAHGLISGYACGGAGEPCDAQNRPYFRQANNATRGQIAKIVYIALTTARK